MKPAAFDYVRPQNLEEALQLISTLEGAKVLAGGQSLMPMLNMRFVQPDHVIDVGRLDLSYIRLDGGQLRIGATTRQRDIELSPLVRQHTPLFVEALQYVGHVQTRNRGTIGGSLCHLDPSAELPAACTTMDAEIVVQSAARGVRAVPMSEFAIAYMTPAIEHDELVTEVRIPIWSTGHGYAVMEFSRRRGDFAIALAAVMVDVSGAMIERAAITVGGLAIAPTRIAAAEQMLTGRDRSEIDIEAAAALCGEIETASDTQASSAYRQQLARVMAARAINLALQRATRKAAP
ncbi:MAG: xanthine dehydrogenase family protein subunit M [Pseudomonadota bacterium]